MNRWHVDHVTRVEGTPLPCSISRYANTSHFEAMRRALFLKMPGCTSPTFHSAKSPSSVRVVIEAMTSTFFPLGPHIDSLSPTFCLFKPYLQAVERMSWIATNRNAFILRPGVAGCYSKRRSAFAWINQVPSGETSLDLRLLLARDALSPCHEFVYGWRRFRRLAWKSFATDVQSHLIPQPLNYPREEAGHRCLEHNEVGDIPAWGHVLRAMMAAPADFRALKLFMMANRRVTSLVHIDTNDQGCVKFTRMIYS